MNDHITLHEAHLTTDWDGAVYNPIVLDNLCVGMIVRISFIVPDNSDLYLLNIDVFNHDSPFLQILKIEDNGDILGLIVPFQRSYNVNYPIHINEKIWFSKKNIIEIPSKHPKNIHKRLINHISDKRVEITGPLYTVIHEFEEDPLSPSDESESEFESEESEEESFMPQPKGISKN